MPVLQSLAHGADKWNRFDQANAIWDARRGVILGGASNSRDLQDLRAGRGTRRIHRLGDVGRSRHPIQPASVRRVPISHWTASDACPSAPASCCCAPHHPIVTDLHPWPSRSDAGQLASDRKEIEALPRRTEN